MDDSDRRERVALHEANKPIPGHIRGRPRSTMEPFLPDSSDPLIEFLQPQPIARNTVIGVSGPEFSGTTPGVASTTGSVPMATTPLVDPFESSAQALSGGLGLTIHFPRRDLPQ